MMISSKPRAHTSANGTNCQQERQFVPVPKRALRFACALVLLFSAALLWAFFFQTASATRGKKAPPHFAIYAHRGGMGEVQPPNSIHAFEHSLDIRVPVLELDVRETRDHTLVVIHDKVLPGGWIHASNATGDAFYQKSASISSLTYEELSKYGHKVSTYGPARGRDVNQSIFLGIDPQAHVPTLDELFAFVREYSTSDRKGNDLQQHANNVQFCIEMKVSNIETPLVTLVQKYLLESRVIIQSFDLAALENVNKLDKRIRTMALTYYPQNPAQLHNRAPFVRYWAPHHLTVSAKAVKTAHDKGLLVIPWTVNDYGKLTELVEFGVDGVMTDYPSGFLHALSGEVPEDDF